jgi:hypothetical protein
MSLFVSVETLALLRLAIRKDDPLIVAALKQLRMNVKLIYHEELQEEIKLVKSEIADQTATVETLEKEIELLKEQLEREINRRPDDYWGDRRPYKKHPGKEEIPWKIPYKKTPWRSDDQWDYKKSPRNFKGKNDHPPYSEWDNLMYSDQVKIK